MLRYSKVLLFSFLAPALLVLVFSAPALHSQEPGSHARIVRISYLEGTVTLNGEQATMNTPIHEGVVLLTATDGLAEVQFEDGSAIRMASETQITFAQLARLTTGEALTRADLDQGEAEFLIPASSAGQFAVNARGKNVMFKDPGRYRLLSTNSSPLEIAVWKGEAIVRDRESGKEVTVKKNETFTLNPSDPGQYDLENALVADDLDQWSNMRDQQLSAVSSTYSSTYSSPYAYPSSSSPFYGYSPFYLYPTAYNCSPWGSGWWDWQPFGFFPGNCFGGGGGFAPFFFFPPTNIFVVPGPLAIPRRPPHIRPPTVPVVASTLTPQGTPTPGPVAIPHRPPHFLRPPVDSPVATAESGSRSVRPGVRSFRFDQGMQRTFNDDNFQRTAARAENPVAEKDTQPAPGTVSEAPSTTLHPLEPLVAPGHRTAPGGNGTPIQPTVAPPPSTSSSHAPPRSSAPSAPSRSYSPPPSSGSHGGFSGGGSASHSSSSSSHSSGGGGRH